MSTAAAYRSGREGDAGERRVAAVGAAHDADALRVGDALGDQVLDAPGDVVLHLVAPLLVAGVQELLAVARRAAEVRLQHRVAAVGQELGEVVEAPAVARPGAAVRHDDRRQVLRRDTLGQRQEGGDHRGRPRTGSGRPSSRPCADGGSARAPCTGRSAPSSCGRTGSASPGSVSLEAVTRHSRSSLVIEPRSTSLPGNFAWSRVVVGLPGGVLEVDPRPLVVVAGRDQLLRRLGEDSAAEVDALQRIGLDVLDLPARGVEEHEPREVGVALVRLHVDAPAVLVEAVRAAALEARCRSRPCVSVVRSTRRTSVSPLSATRTREPQLRRRGRRPSRRSAPCSCASARACRSRSRRGKGRARPRRGR